MAARMKFSGGARHPKSGKSGGCGLPFVFIIFTLFGLGFSAFFVWPMIRSFQARNWLEVPCTIVTSEVKEHDGDDGSTYSVAITFDYEVAGRKFRGDRYQFMTGSSSGRDGKQEVVNQYPPGKRTVCYVNPDDPADAVLYRGLTAGLWFILLPLLFVGVGAGGLIYSIRQKGKQDVASRTAWLPTKLRSETSTSTTGLPEPSPEGDGPVTLKPESSRLGVFVAVVLIAAFWNGIVSVFVWQMIKSFQDGDPEWFLVLFLIPFELIGLALICGIGYAFLALFNPKTILRVSSQSVRLGEPLRLGWKFTGRVSAIRHLKITLEGREEATYQRGTTTTTDKNEFTKVDILDTEDPAQIEEGAAEVIIPEDTMHSFESGHNKIVWTLVVHGAIRLWPDVKEKFPFTVLPHDPSRWSPA